KRNGAGARRLDPLSSVAARRNGSWTPAALSRLHLSAQKASRRAAFGLGGEVRRRKADRGECFRRERDQDPAVSRGDPRFEGQQDGPPGGSSQAREQESGAELEEHCRRGTGERERSTSLSSAALRSRDFLAARD